MNAKKRYFNMQKCVHVECIFGIVFIIPIESILNMFNEKLTHLELFLRRKSVAKIIIDRVAFKNWNT